MLVLILQTLGVSMTCGAMQKSKLFLKILKVELLILILEGRILLLILVFDRIVSCWNIKGSTKKDRITSPTLKTSVHLSRSEGYQIAWNVRRIESIFKLEEIKGKDRRHRQELHRLGCDINRETE